MSRVRVLIRMTSADAFELKAQALNKDSRLSSARISALKFSGDKFYMADGEFSPTLPPPAAPEAASVKKGTESPTGSNVRVVVRMTSADAFEMKAKALNNDPRLKEAGIAALKFVGEGLYITDGNFSPAPLSPKPKAATGAKLRVLLHMTNRDAYELKAQALNNDPRLKHAGITALKFTGDQQTIAEGKFSPDPSAVPAVKKLRVVLRAPRALAYDLLARHLNGDPAFAKAGVSGVELAKGAGMVPVPQKPLEQPVPVSQKKRSFARVLVTGLIVALIGATGAGALFFSRPPAPTPTLTATVAAVIPAVMEPTNTDTPVPPTETSIPPTETRVTSTSTQPPTATETSSPTPTACLPPAEVVVFAENLSCRYGPGAVYLYRTGLVKDMVVDALGRADSAYGTWIRVRTRWEEPVTCWVNSGPRFVEIPQGDVACLEPLYPEKAPLIIYNTDLFPKPSNVGAGRNGNLVFISWTGFDLLPGDKPPASMRYLVETWTCQEGKIVFTPQGTDETFAQVRDDGGCDEPSRGFVYMAHVDGYIGPVAIPWPE